MEHLDVIYGRSYLPISIAIQLRTWCLWSHVGILLPDGAHVLEARGGMGVVLTRLEDFKWRYRETMTGYIHCESVQKALEYAWSRHGRDYDRKAFWGIGLGVNLHDSEAYQCAELVAMASGVFPKDETPFLVPKDILRLTHDRKKSR
jgi:hypothetical protein